MRNYGLLAALALASTAGSSNAFWRPFECPPEHTLERAGNPQCISKCAAPSRNCNYLPGYVGGGCLWFKGDSSRPCDEGTFGYDYAGCIFTRPGRVFLSWCGCDGKKSGPYKTDGPHVPDVFAIRPVKRAIEKKHEKKHESCATNDH